MNFPERPTWQVFAPCAQPGVNPDWWFPPVGDNGREAKRICRGCPYRAPCLRGALERHERFGLYGGVSIAQLRKSGCRGDQAKEVGVDDAA